MSSSAGTPVKKKRNSISLASDLKPAASLVTPPGKNGTPRASVSHLVQGGSPGLAARGSGSDGKGAKKLVIKNLRTRPPAGSSSQADFTAQALQTLVRATRAILSTPPEPIPESLQALYTLCEGIVGSSSASASSNTAQTLYDRIRIEVERKVGENAATLRSLDTQDPEAWLGQLDALYKAFNEKMLLVRSIFLHLDRTYVLQTPSLLSLWDMGSDIFRHRVVEDAQIGLTITGGLTKLIDMERGGEVVLQILIAQVISLLSALSPTCHTTIFFNPFVGSSTTFYQLEAARLLNVAPSGADEQIGSSVAGNYEDAADMPIPAYLGHVRKRLAEEGTRADLVLGKDVKGPVLRVVEETLVGAHIAVLLQRGLAAMLDQEMVQDLAGMYSLFGKVGALKQLRESFHEYVKFKGTAIVSDTSRDESMVTSLIALQSLTERVLREAFSSDFELTKTSKDAFIAFINVRQNKPAEMIAKFIDAKMRSGNKSMDDEELERTFRNVLQLFRYCQGKDIFEAFYKKDFAKRLLLNRSASSDAEKSMLLKLKEECGPAFTAKLETMAKDIDLSADIMKAYKDSLGPDISSILSVNILTAGNWPTYHKQPVRIPDSLQRELERFGRFYKAKYAGRSISFMHSLDQCTLKVEFDKGPGGGRKELNVSFHQAVILLLFDKLEKDEKIVFKDILEQTGLERKEANRTLQSLACAKIKVLTKHPKGRDVNEDDTFSFNSSFKDDKYRLKINQIQQKETVEEQKSTTQQVLLDRQSHLQLVIVRILKSRKTIKHVNLIMEVVDSLKERFKVDPPEIKKAIDSLIDRDYMEREGRDAYNYLA